MLLTNGIYLKATISGTWKLKWKYRNVFPSSRYLRRIRSLAEDFELPAPEFIETPNSFRVNLFRKTTTNNEQQYGNKTSEKLRNNFGITSEKLRNNFEETSELIQNPSKEVVTRKQTKLLEQLNNTQKKIVELLKENPNLTAESLAKQLCLSSRSIEYNIQKIKELGLIVRHGSHKDGYWEVKV